MSNQTIVDVVVNDSTATVVDNRDLSNLTIDLNATGQLLTNNLISSGNYLDSEIAIVSGIAQSGSNESLTGQINQLSGNLITTGQTLQTQITSNDSDINTLTTNLATTGETLTSEINSISGVVPTGGATNQVLAKIDSTDYNTQWVDQSGGGGGSGTVTSSTATTNYLTKWTNGAGEVIGNSILYDNGSNIGIGTTSPSDKLEVYGNIRVRGSDGFGVNGTDYYDPSYVVYPGGGKGSSNSTNRTGYIKIRLPQSWTNTMMQFSVDIFEYQDNKAKTFVLAGYNNTGNSWFNASAMVLGANDSTEYKIEFGHDGSKCAIYISKGTDGASSTWVIPHVVVRNVSFSYLNVAISNWIDDWSVGFTPTLGTITETRNVSAHIAGSGTSQYIPKWDSTGISLNDSVIVQDSNNIGIGTASPSSKLHVYGGDAIINTLNIGLGAGSNNSTNTSIGVDSLSNNTIGIQNVAVGYQTLLNNTEGIRNVSVGYQSLYTNTTGDSNISIGYKSLHFNLIGLQNIGIGDFSLFNNTGSSNTAVGFSALKSNTSGNDNSAIGFNSLLNNTTGTRNTAQGFEVLYSNTTGGYNVAIGYKSIYNNTSGTFNVANGYLSLYANTTGSNNVAVGYQAGRFITDGSTANTTGDYNVFLGTDTKALADNDQNEIVIGYNATGLGSNSAVLGNDSITKTVLKGNVGIGTAAPSSKLHVYGGDAIINTLTIGLGAGSVSSNTSIGLDSLSNNTTGSQNVAVGTWCLYNNTEGIRNIAVGYQSLFTNTTGDSNISIGWQGLFYNTTGDHNIALGYRSLYANTTGNQNTAFGYLSLSANTIGSNNVANGFGALSGNTTGSRNVAIGNSSLGANTTGDNNAASGYLSLYGNATGRDNTAFGYRAGWFITDGSTANTTGAYNIFIGSLTKALADNDQNEIVIGYNATGLGSNSAVLGNDSITKTVLKGNVGIGTTAPSSKLHVNGMISAGIAGNNSANYAALLVSSTGTGTQQSAIAIQQTYPNGNTIIWADLEPYAEYNFSHNGIENAFTFNSGFYGSSLKSTVIRNRSGAQRISFEKVKIWQNTAQVDVGGAISIGQLGAGGETSPTIRLTIKDLQDSSFNSGIALVRSTNTDTAYINIVGGNLNLNAPTGASTQFKVAGTNTFAIAANGSISSSTGASLSSGGTWTDASTRELKQDIKDLDYRESLNIIKHLNPVKFAYKKDPKNKKIGFIAEDVPDLVATEDRKGLSALQIVSALTKVVQSQQKEIQQLKRMMKRLNKIK